MFKYIIGIILISQNILAQDMEYKLSYDGFFIFDSFQHEDSVINPGNEVLQQPDFTLTSDQRLDFKFLINDGKIIFRPHWLYTQSKFKTTISNANKMNSDSKLDIFDFFYEQVLNQKLFFTLGLQSYQWGPAELLNPSNPFFHFESGQRSFGFKEKGKVLTRLNWNTSKENSIVFIAEPISNQEKNWIYNEDFKAQSAVKFEKEFKSARHLIGLTSGKPQDADLFIGEYGQFEIIDGLTIYADSKQSQSKIYFRPEQVGSLYRLNRYSDVNQFSQLTVVGLRYEGDFDTRVEYIYNSLGYTQTQFTQALIAMSQISIYQAENLKAFQSIGLELISQNYVYFSLRKTESFSIRDFNIYVRSVNSMMDSSGVDQIEFDKALGDYTTLFGQLAMYRGDLNTEFKLANDYKGTVGVKATY